LPVDRQTALQNLDEGNADGARARALALLPGVGLTTLQRWRRQFAVHGYGVDRHKGSPRHMAHRLSEEERQRILLTCNEPEFAALPPGQIVPFLADRSLSSALNAVSTGCCTPMARLTGAFVPGLLKSKDPYRVFELLGRTRCGAGT
jgi:hypothetical protein